MIKRKLIDANKLIEGLRLISQCWSISPCLSDEKRQYAISNMRAAIKEVENAPEVTDVKEIIHAKWEMVLDDFDDGMGERELPHCSNCHTGVYKHDAKNWCPECGAQMDLK